MNEKFQIVMRSVDDDLLEEAMEPVKSRRSVSLFRAAAAAAAFFMILAAQPLLQSIRQNQSLNTLTEMGYEMTIPEDAKRVKYEVVTLYNRKGAQAAFSVGKTDYLYQAVKSDTPISLSQNAAGDAQLLSWNAESIPIELLASSSGTSVSWYTEDNQTQWFLTASADSPDVLQTASQIMEKTGFDVTNAPEGSEQVSYHAFLLNDLTVAETTFVQDDVTYSYRRAATMELKEDFTDISGMEESYKTISAAEISWCKAKISLSEDGSGKIIWFDIVPGILYSLSMDSGATEELLIEMANTLFVPAQDNIG